MVDKKLDLPGLHVAREIMADEHRRIAELAVRLAPCTPVAELTAALQFCTRVLDMVLAGDSFQQIGAFIAQHDLRRDETVH